MPEVVPPFTHERPARSLHDRIAEAELRERIGDARAEVTPANTPPSLARRPLAAATSLRGGARLDVGLLDNALLEAKAYTRVTFGVFLASIIVVFVLAVIAGAVFVARLTSGAEWQGLAVAGGFSFVLLLLLAVLQYRPAKGYGLAASRAAQLEAKRAQINRSFELWERFLNDAEGARTLTAADVATAVASLTAATDGIVSEATAEPATTLGASEAKIEPKAARRLAPYTFLRRNP